MTTDEAVDELQKRYGPSSNTLLSALHDGVGSFQIEPHEGSVFIGFLIAGTAAQKHLKRGLKERDISYISWATRNLLELLVWSRYCAFSKQNTLRFYQDSVRDLAGTMAAFRELAQYGSETVGAQNLEIVEETETKTMHLAARFGVIPLDVGFLPVATAATEIGMDVDYRKANKILSKLVHPTAYMVCTSVGDGLSGSACEHFFMTGVVYALRVHSIIRGFVQRLRPDASSEH